VEGDWILPGLVEAVFFLCSSLGASMWSRSFPLPELAGFDEIQIRQ
jgi:hypothetical protein